MMNRLPGLLCALALSGLSFGGHRLVIRLRPSPGLMTSELQHAIDSCAASGGGDIVLTPGVYHSGTIELMNGISLLVEKGAVLAGSTSYADYRHDAFLYGEDLTDMLIGGGGIIDGEDCYNPHGEEGFRGPHCLRLVNCRDVQLAGLTIRRSANWAVNCRHCSRISLHKVTILGGHDGLHTRFCDHVTVTDCDFRTGDDSFAGNDNQYFEISHCRVNSSCNCFRLGCLHLTVSHCHLWGPGQYAHRIEKQRRYPAAFVHFSPTDEHPVLCSGDWLIDDVTMDSVAYIYFYNFENGLWQTGQPVTTIQFKHIRAEAVGNGFYIIGDTSRLFDLRVEDSHISSCAAVRRKNITFDGVPVRSQTALYADRFDTIGLRRTTFTGFNKTYQLAGGGFFTSSAE